MRIHYLVSLCSAALHCCISTSFSKTSESFSQDWRKRELLQNIVTWDEKSLYIYGERVMIWSGEVHPFRLPVPSLWIDVFEKVKALGFNTVSFYVYWALLEAKQGSFQADGIFDLKPFFQAATDAGIYLIARPGPYINAEVAGGGFPGWLQRVNATLRTSSPEYLAAIDNYLDNIFPIIADAQITKGGPVIVVQPENEYTYSYGGFSTHPPDPLYMQYVMDKAHEHGIVMPMVGNDAFEAGRFVPGTGRGEFNIYGYDQYPLGFSCNDPEYWPAIGLTPGMPTLTENMRATHLSTSPSTPLTIPEFQGGGSPPWGGSWYSQCAEQINHEYERVFYKNNLAAGIAYMNIYMIFGGTSWGYISYAAGYTSYDYGAAIAENGRTITREKYAELKLEAQFIKASPSYLEATPANLTTGVYSQNLNITVTPLIGCGSFFVIRHTNFSSRSTTAYSIRLPTSVGNVTVPLLGGSLTLHGRDSKIHVTDYPIGNITLLYSTAEIFTWKLFQDKKVLILYGGPSELHEVAILTSSTPSIIEGDCVTIKNLKTTAVLQWETSPVRRIVQVGDLLVYILDRQSAYNYWVPDLASNTSVIVNGGHLVRSVQVQNDSLSIRVDFNSSATAKLELIGVPKGIQKLILNNREERFTISRQGSWITSVHYQPPELVVPLLSDLNWTYIDSLPELQPSFDDSQWPNADHITTNNTSQGPLPTPVSLYASDYGFHCGVLVYRGHFVADGPEATLHINTTGGLAFASSAFLNDQFLGSWVGSALAVANVSSYTLPMLEAGQSYNLTILVDNNGNDNNWSFDSDYMKSPRGIVDYSILSPLGSVTSITWKLTGNLGGENFIDRERGPLNEGGLFVERHGFHLPDAPSSQFQVGSPFEGSYKAGVTYYTALLRLDYPSDEFDIPVSFVFGDISNSTTKYRAVLVVNGFTFGKYISHIGPQIRYPVPEGIINYKGDNSVGLFVWAVETGGAKLTAFSLSVGNPILTSRQTVELVKASPWHERPGVY